MKKKGKKRKASDIILTIIIILVVCGFIFGLYNMLKGFITGDSEKDKVGRKTELQQLIDKDLDGKYPETPREVVKVYCKITKQLYYGSCTEEQEQKLFSQMRKLFDAELIAKNSDEENWKGLQSELGEFENTKMKVVSYSLQKIDDVQTYNYNGVENAIVKVAFSMKEKNKWKKVNEEFVVRKDAEGRWKIYGWQKSNTAVEGDEE